MFSEKIGVIDMSETQNEIQIQITPTLKTRLVAVQKRSGETVPFDSKKIFEAVKKAVAVTTEISDVEIVKVTQEVLKRLDDKFADKTPTVEDVQDIVVCALMDSRAYKTAQAYIIYRQISVVMCLHPLKPVFILGTYPMGKGSSPTAQYTLSRRQQGQR